MSVSSVSNRWLNRIYKTIAILLVTFAVLISALRLLLPYAHHYRIDLQNQINQQFNTDIRIGSLSMGWEKSGPILIAQQVNLINSDAIKVVLGQFNVEVNFWQSLRQRSLVTNNLNLRDVYVYLNKQAFNQVRQTDTAKDQYQLIENIANLFLLQMKSFSLTNSNLTIEDHGIRKEIALAHLDWQNKDNRHVALGEITLNRLTSDTLHLQLELVGNTLSSLEGQVYVNAKTLNIAPWLDSQVVTDLTQTVSDINFDVWANVREGRVSKIQVELKPSALAWGEKEERQIFALEHGSLLLEEVSTGQFSITSSPIQVAINDTPWQPFQVDALLHPSETNLVYVSHIDVAGLSQILPLFSASDSTLLSQLSPQGQLKDIYWRGKGDSFQASLLFDDISLNYSQGIPGIEHVSGDLILDNQTLAGQLISKDSALDFDKHFLQPMPFTQLSVTFDGNWQADQVQFNAREVTFLSDALELTAEVGITVPEQAPVSMSLLAQVHRGEAEQAALFYPHLLMGDNLVNYLGDSIITGQVAQAQVLFNGPFASFPFKENQGIFVVDAELEQAKFSFDSQWPAITNLSANLNFTNNSMLITAREGRLSGLDVQGVTAEIADLKNEQLLIVDANIEEQLPENITTLMQASSLQDSVGEVLSQLTVSGPVSGEFNLKLPLANVEEVVASGRIAFNDNQLVLSKPAMDFTHVNGELFFVNDQLTTEDVSLRWLDMPVALAVIASDRKNHYQTDIKMTANWQEQHWRPHVPDTLNKYVDGITQWQGDLSLYTPHTGGFSYDLTMTSDLMQAILNLPEPYVKTTGQQLPLLAKVEGQSAQSTINISLGEQLSFYGMLNHDLVSFSRAHLVLGQEQMLLPMDGFHITTNLETTDIIAWEPLIQDILTSLPAGETGQARLLEKPERIRGTIQHLEMFGQSLNEVSFNLLDQENWWLLHVNAKEIRSQVKFYPDWYQQGIEVDADFIRIPVGEEETNEESQTTVFVEPQIQDYFSEQEKLIFNEIPPMRVQCDDCQIGLMNLGEVSFDIERTDQNNISLNNFKALKGKNKLLLEGGWHFDGETVSQTSISGSYVVRDIEQEMEQYGFASIIKDSGLESTFAINWRGGPNQFDLAGVNGDINVALDDGYLADISDKGARIFSILSLQSLVRKLTLDFRDIFSDGMFYSSIKGDLHLKDGVLYTDNTRMKGAAGDLTIKGNTGLSNGLLDYRMSYKPNLTASLPVLAWIATLNPVTFLAGVAIDEVFTSQVVSEFDFELTGSINEPNLKEVNRKTKDVSVGRSTPPQFVEHSPTPSELPVEQKPPTAPENQEKDKSDG